MLEDINYNFYLRFSIEIVLEIVLFSQLNARHMNSYGSLTEVFFSVTGLAGLAFGISIPSFCAFLIGRDPLNKDKRMSSLTDDINKGKGYGKFYVPLFMMQRMLFSSMLVIFMEYPYFQCFFAAVVSIIVCLDLLTYVDVSVHALC